ncbi:MAG: HAMP domain-containing protein [Deltaproteobacteria bacterium]|nr:HAMP domain-containing protein [Deltaproteobacteria bacterium]
MIAQWNIFSRIFGRLFLPAALGGWAILACFVTPDSAFAATDMPPGNAQTKQITTDSERDQRPRRIPPRVAVEACVGKKEGDPCSFNSPQGVLDGLCFSGDELVFACRPHRGGEPPEASQGKTTEQQTTPRVPSRLNSNYDLLERYIGSLGSYLIVAVLAAGLAWYWFFRNSTLPLRRLRKVTQQLAEGDLSARVGEGLVHRKDEIADLGRDVDRMAERIESLVSAHQRLIRDVSHELRSPLSRLNVALELARQSAGPTHAAPFDRIERESDRLNELIAQLLMLTKLESESGMNQRTNIDLTALIMEIAQDVDFEAKNNDRRVVTTASEPLILSGNKELLRQALENLIRNAARYTAAGTAVEISLGKKELSGRGWAHIEVKDQGPGVPESELSDIFRPFYRVNDARERQSGGAGVGLAISDRAVRLHGGSLRAFNAPGVGLIMEIDLPLP